MCCPLLLSYSLSASYRRSKESGAPLSLHNHTPEIMNNQMGEEGVLYWQQVYFDPEKFSGSKYQQFWYTQNLYLII